MIQSALAQVGFGKQTAKGTPASNPGYAFGLTDGAIVTVDISQDLEERTSGSRLSTAVNRTGVMPGIDWSCRAHTKSVAGLLYAALGSIASTGAGPYTHTITTADDLPYFTFFGKHGSTIYAVNDGKIDELTISFSEANPVEVSASGMGTTLNPAATFVPTTDDTVASYLSAASGTFKLDIDSATPVTARIASGEVSISNSLEAIMVSGAITPNDVFPGRQDIGVSLEIVPDNFDEWRTILTGSNSGTDASVTPIFGSFEFTFTDGANSLKLAATKVAFTADFPSADPAGGAMRLSLEGLVVKPEGGQALTATVVNTVASY